MSSATMYRLVEAAMSLAAAPAGELPDAQVVDELLALRRLADVAEAAYLSRLAVFDTRRLGEVDGLSTRAWLRHHANIAPSETSRAVKTATTVHDHLPVVADALAAGEIRVPHAGAITDGVSLLGVDVIAECQDVLVGAARADEPAKLRAGLRGLGAATENPRAVREAERRDEGRWLDLATTFDGAVHLAGILGAEDGAVVKAAVDALTTPVAGDPRTSAQRRADALTEVCRRQLNTGTLPTTGGEAPHLLVITDHTTLHPHTNTEDHGRHTNSDDSSSAGSDSAAGNGYRNRATSGFGELPDGNILTGDAVRRLACDAKITPITTTDSLPLNVGRTHRTATGAQRRALRIRDNGCRFPGCHRPVDWCDTHHITPWSHGGTTNIHNLILLCRKHHTTIHEHGWNITTTDTGDIEFTNPHGQRTHTPPPAPTRHLTNQLASATANETGRPP